MRVLEPVPKMDFFEVRIYDTIISKRKLESVEVVIQSQVKRVVPDQFAEVAQEPRFPYFVVKEHKDWQVSSRQERSTIFDDVDGKRYMYPWIIEVVQLYPRRTGQFIVDDSLFVNLPTWYKIKPHTIEVLE